MPVYCFSLFSPTLINNLGYTAARSQLLSVPPYVGGAIATILAGFLSDRAQKRGIYVLLFSLIGIVGFTMCIASGLPGVGYAGLHVAAIGIYPLVCSISSVRSAVGKLT